VMSRRGRRQARPAVDRSRELLEDLGERDAGPHGRRGPRSSPARAAAGPTPPSAGYIRRRRFSHHPDATSAGANSAGPVGGTQVQGDGVRRRRRRPAGEPVAAAPRPAASRCRGQSGRTCPASRAWSKQKQSALAGQLRPQQGSGAHDSGVRDLSSRTCTASRGGGPRRKSAGPRRSGRSRAGRGRAAVGKRGFAGAPSARPSRLADAGRAAGRDRSGQPVRLRRVPVTSVSRRVSSRRGR